MDSVKKDFGKSRNQKFSEYFIILQKEYIVAELRKKIYPDVTGKQKSQQIMEGKKKKILDIAMRNGLKTIFIDLKLGDISLYDEDLRVRLYREIYGSGGLPNFIYRDEKQKSRLRPKDKNCYFMPGSEILTPDGIGNLQNTDFDKEVCYVKIKGKNVKYEINDIRRIL